MFFLAQAQMLLSKAQITKTMQFRKSAVIWQRSKSLVLEYFPRFFLTETQCCLYKLMKCGFSYSKGPVVLPTNFMSPELKKVLRKCVHL